MLPLGYVGFGGYLMIEIWSNIICRDFTSLMKNKEERWYSQMRTGLLLDDLFCYVLFEGFSIWWMFACCLDKTNYLTFLFLVTLAYKMKAKPQEFIDHHSHTTIVKFRSVVIQCNALSQCVMIIFSPLLNNLILTLQISRILFFLSLSKQSKT